MFIFVSRQFSFLIALLLLPMFGNVKSNSPMNFLQKREVNGTKKEDGYENDNRHGNKIEHVHSAEDRDGYGDENDECPSMLAKFYCLNKGKCVLVEERPICECADDFQGIRCEHSYDSKMFFFF